MSRPDTAQMIEALEELLFKLKSGEAGIRNVRMTQNHNMERIETMGGRAEYAQRAFPTVDIEMCVEMYAAPRLPDPRTGPPPTTFDPGFIDAVRRSGVPQSKWTPEMRRALGVDEGPPWRNTTEPVAAPKALQPFGARELDID